MTIVDPCDADDVWSDSIYDAITYVIGDPVVSVTNATSNKLNATFCNFLVVDVLDDWSNSLSPSNIVSATNTNTTLTLDVQTQNNSKRLEN